MLLRVIVRVYACGCVCFLVQPLEQISHTAVRMNLKVQLHRGRMCVCVCESVRTRSHAKIGPAEQAPENVSDPGPMQSHW